MFGWLARRKAYDEAVHADARAMIDHYGEQAFFEARLRQHETDTIDNDRPPGHWERVKEEIRRMQKAR